jgi:hypothetical protein
MRSRSGGLLDWTKRATDFELLDFPLPSFAFPRSSPTSISFSSQFIGAMDSKEQKKRSLELTQKMNLERKEEGLLFFAGPFLSS